MILRQSLPGNLVKVEATIILITEAQNNQIQPWYCKNDLLELYLCVSISGGSCAGSGGCGTAV